MGDEISEKTLGLLRKSTPEDEEKISRKDAKAQRGRENGERRKVRGES
jgi:hypothetical protein